MTIFVICWIVCGIINYGLTVHYYQTKYALIAKDHIVGDRVFAGLVSLVGPVGLVAFFSARTFGPSEFPNPKLGWML